MTVVLMNYCQTQATSRTSNQLVNLPMRDTSSFNPISPPNPLLLGAYTSSALLEYEPNTELRQTLILDILVVGTTGKTGMPLAQQ